MKLWQKGIATDREVERFTAGEDAQLDLLLAEFDVLGSLAHARMLAETGILSTENAAALDQELKAIYREIESGSFVIEPGVEDVHSQVEKLLTERIGEAGKQIHSGRSRNDQVLLDIRLLVRREIQGIVDEVQALFDILLQLSDKHRAVLLPGYTHFQVAMPSSFGLWFAAYAESLLDDLIQLQGAYRIINKNPLGSAAGYGSSFPLDRRMTSELLGFDTLNYNSVYAQMGRGKTETVVSSALASIAATLGKLAMDICLYLSQNFAFISFPDALTTGSSIMPHKKNPDVFELIRARCNRLQALPGEIRLIGANLPSGYHRDMQEIKARFLPAFTLLRDCLRMASLALPQIAVREDILADEKYRYLFSVDAVNQLVMEGRSFRDAYREVGEAIERGEFTPPPALAHTHEGSIGNLCNEEVREEFERVVKAFDFAKVERALAGLLGREVVP